MDKQVTVLKKDLSPFIKESRFLVITDMPSMERAVEMLSVLNRIGDRITEEKEKVTKPLNQALKAERARWKPLETVYEEAISGLRAKITNYQTAEVKRKQEEEAKIAARVGVGKGKLTLETAVKKIEEVGIVEKKVYTDMGSILFQEKKFLKIVDVSKIPREYLVVDERKVFDALKNGVVVPGAKIETKMVPINFR